MLNDFTDEKIVSREACQNRLPQFFSNKGESFFESGISIYLQNGN